MVLRVFILTALSICAPLFAASGNSSLRVHPHQYADPRGSEPNAQAIGLAKASFADPQDQNNSWYFSFHLEGETAGRRDVSLDLDRGWFRLGGTSQRLTLGRIHPYELLNHPAALQSWAWGLFAASEPQNFGVQLGYGYADLSPAPSPILMGWLGAHYDVSAGENMNLAFSASPFFLPSMGAEVSLYKDGPASVGRFARRPPGSVVLDNRSFAIRYEVDRSRLFQDVILNPQLMAQLKLNTSDEQIESWTTIARHPNPNPQFKSEEYLIVTETSVDAYARVQPRYLQRVTGSQTLRWKTDLGFNPIGSVKITDDGWWGWEFAAESKYLLLSLSNDQRYSPEKGDFYSTEVRYADYLAAATLELPLSDTVLAFSGIKYHLRQRDYWSYAGLRLRIFKHAILDTGVDLFSGDEATYFGEWRSNNRIGTALIWEIGV